LISDACIRQFLLTGDEASLAHIIYKSDISPDSVRKMLPPDLLNTNPPLVPVQKQPLEAGEPDVMVARNLDGPGPVFGEYNKADGASPKDLKLSFNVPKGTREISMLVAGRVDFHVASYPIRPLLAYDLWRSITIPIDPDATGFDITASADALRGMRFSAPTISAHHTLGRWAREIVGDSARNSLTRILLAGLILMVGALIRMAMTPAGKAPGRSLARSVANLFHVGRDAWLGTSSALPVDVPMPVPAPKPETIT
jgi:hypothetical protein